MTKKKEDWMSKISKICYNMFEVTTDFICDDNAHVLEWLEFFGRSGNIKILFLIFFIKKFKFLFLIFPTSLFKFWLL